MQLWKTASLHSLPLSIITGHFFIFHFPFPFLSSGGGGQGLVLTFQDPGSGYGEQ
jgi:hypothetical protein